MGAIATRLTALGVLLLLLGTACGQQVDSHGPLAVGDGEPARFCMEQAGRATIALDLLHNLGTEAVTLTDVALIGPHNVALIDAFVVPEPEPDADGTRTLIGTWPSYPPPQSEVRQEWFARELAVGAAIPAGGARGLVVGLDSSGPAAVDAIRIDYTDESGKRYTARTSVQIGMGTPPPPVCRD